MAQKKYEIGFRAAKILIDSIKKNTLPKRKVVLDAKLIERESCKKIS
jgi:DNA-binding LacI/PurR family transcriptional regulator